MLNPELAEPLKTMLQTKIRLLGTPVITCTKPAELMKNGVLLFPVNRHGSDVFVATCADALPKHSNRNSAASETIAIRRVTNLLFVQLAASVFILTSSGRW
jgi:hypothetical protein